ncbi:hypothetical protein SPOG_00012 [Schizosaccharomyces cryophilus OY26]|uniref:Uncharacterized protein n=1 Tax=Schizosaccharomyces cryophilus (strain OY26 / ATCC MYA-4695 / CBS 11777 / NBRC 106824 / NRRL Y48691) TaxID=653667 RepID=S9XCK1_SCHCR|nr:uncharacterized protein SPOG_00012 [Schizosaccharomyces cryophilus OY26]EPY51586.1 hypothetical protein SPOG_00012 [Schizosaccharomyces cryophilus OY26]
MRPGNSPVYTNPMIRASVVLPLLALKFWIVSSCLRLCKHTSLFLPTVNEIKLFPKPIKESFFSLERDFVLHSTGTFYCTVRNTG